MGKIKVEDIPGAKEVGLKWMMGDGIGGKRKKNFEVAKKFVEEMQKIIDKRK